MGPRAPPGGVGSRRPTCQAWLWCPSGRLVKLGRGEGGPTSRGPCGTRREKRDRSETRVALGLSHVRNPDSPGWEPGSGCQRAKPEIGAMTFLVRGGTLAPPVGGGALAAIGPRGRGLEPLLGDMALAATRLTREVGPRNPNGEGRGFDTHGMEPQKGTGHSQTTSLARGGALGHPGRGRGPGGCQDSLRAKLRAGGAPPPAAAGPSRGMGTDPPWSGAGFSHQS